LIKEQGKQIPQVVTISESEDTYDHGSPVQFDSWEKQLNYAKTAGGRIRDNHLLEKSIKLFYGTWVFFIFYQTLFQGGLSL